MLQNLLHNLPPQTVEHRNQEQKVCCSKLCWPNCRQITNLFISYNINCHILPCSNIHDRNPSTGTTSTTRRTWRGARSSPHSITLQSLRPPPPSLSFTTININFFNTNNSYRLLTCSTRAACRRRCTGDWRTTTTTTGKSPSTCRGRTRWESCTFCYLWLFIIIIYYHNYQRMITK